MKSELIKEVIKTDYPCLKKSTIDDHIVYFVKPGQGVLLLTTCLEPGEVIGKSYIDWDESKFRALSKEDKVILYNVGDIDTGKYPILRKASFSNGEFYIVLFSAKDTGVIVYSDYSEAVVTGNVMWLPEHLYTVLSVNERVILENA